MTIATLLFALIALPAGADRPGEPIMLDFTAVWCGPCRSMKPAVETLVEKGYPIKAVDLDQHRDLADRYGVTGVPTFIVVDPDGRELARTSGAQPAINLANMYREAKSKYLAGRTPADTAEDDADSDSGSETESDSVSGPDPKAKARSAPAPAPEEKRAKPNPDPWETVVRIKVHARGSIGFGSGTIIHSTPQETLILTCAHIFKMDGRPPVHPSKFPLKITVDLFDGQLTGTRPSQVHYANETFEGQAVDYDTDRDVGLIRIRPGRRLPYAKVVPPHWSPKEGFGMITVGCSEGHDASAWRTTIVNPDMKGLQGHSTYEAIECMIAPKEGRSGGGLFTSDGYVAGVCDFAEPRGNHGLYAHPSSIYKILDRNQLTALYDPAKSSDRLLADRGGAAKPGRTEPPLRVRTQSPEVMLPPPEMLGIRPPRVKPAAEVVDGSDAASSRKPSWRPHTIPTGQKLDPSLDPNRFGADSSRPRTSEPETAPAADEPAAPAESAPAPTAPSRSSAGKWQKVRTPLPEFNAPAAN